MNSRGPGKLATTPATDGLIRGLNRDVVRCRFNLDRRGGGIRNRNGGDNNRFLLLCHVRNSAKVQNTQHQQTSTSTQPLFRQTRMEIAKDAASTAFATAFSVFVGQPLGD
jgi:hypothetical protein